ncbi:MAG: hypothetical protein ACKN9V_07630 [Pseudomonadota bacterium]
MCLMVSVAHASIDVSKKLQLQEMLERRLTPIIQATDIDAKVYVTIEAAEEVEPVDPNIPFALQKYVYSARSSFSKVNVLVLGRFKELPASTKSMIKKLTKDLGAPVFLTVENLSSLPKTEFSDRGPTSISVQGLDGIKNAFAHLGDLVMALMGFLSFVGCIGAIFFFKARNEEPMESTKPLASEPLKTVKGYSDESLTSVLSDCYWCEEDRYASLLWKQIPVEQRKSVVNGAAFLSRYIENVMNLDGQNKQYLEHPYYLNPMSINHLDNKTLTDMTQKHPGLLTKLSPMRRNYLSLSACERVRAELEAGSKASAPDLMRLPADSERGFETLNPIVLRSVREEEEVLNLKGITLEMKRRIPSLQWFCELSNENKAAVLDAMTTKELASAWIGPGNVLDILNASLSKRRKEELKTMLSEVEPSRDSSGFKKLHSMVIEALKSTAAKKHETKIKKVA